MQTMLQRRPMVLGLLAGMPACVLGAEPIGPWLPYRPEDVKRIEPTGAPLPQISRGVAAPTRRIDPVLNDMRPDIRPASMVQSHPPKAYAVTAARMGVPPWLLFGVALQESKLKFGERTLPYPWTLCVRGQGLRYADYPETLAALKGFIARRVTNIDIGAMQVNWHWHGDKLQQPERALDPYPNLAVGAQILRGHFEAGGNWRRAIALYHTGSDNTRETLSRGARYADQVLQRLGRMGVPVAALLQSAPRLALGGSHAQA
ncbi:transglycosylase SLT domain-containing protein [Acidovorax sp. SUPP2539]|uniref:transglycosylase SLT domain-containing protein n=1 Tax=Acidovorax sp. SUPP2539 TaxID=2920878 RepID=UPI0023DE64E1|nr:transglycosylase SLT domain-containing protein [Acidovorax sp. SUPP2539]GKS92650.1 transglycosylase SLT domain-containing protein [Acidovorax sp. SUPP2539]